MSIIFDTKQKLLFKFGNSVCKEERWVHILGQNFSNFLKRLREMLKDDLEIFFYLRFQIYSFIFINLALYSVFAHFCFCKRTCDKKKSRERYYIFCYRIYLQIFDDERIFNDIIIGERDFTPEFNEFFSGMSFFLLIFVTRIHFL